MMKTLFLSFTVIAMCAIGSLASAQSLQPSWGYSFDETVAGKQIIFIAPLVFLSGCQSDPPKEEVEGQVFVVTKGPDAVDRFLP